MTTDEVLLGVGLTLAIAATAQVVASRLRIPALIILLPAGFLAGAFVDDLDPQNLLGDTFGPLVSLAVAIVLYDAGLGLRIAHLRGNTRRVVRRLILVGVPITWVVGFCVAVPALGMSAQAAAVLAAILTVSGPTVVGPLLAHIRPREQLKRILAWEGSLIDPVGAILGAVLFNAVVASTIDGPRGDIVAFVSSISIGLVGGAIGTALIWLLLGMLRLDESLGTIDQHAAVVAVAAACDIVRDDTGLIAAIMMGLAASHLPGLGPTVRRDFFETLVQLIIGVLFVSISATVTPASLGPVAVPTLILVAAYVLVARPWTAWLSTMGTSLDRGERTFVGWMAPRGIVAAATATTFGTALTQRGVPGAEHIVPVTFLVVVATVTLYGLTAVPVARRLGVTPPSPARPDHEAGRQA
jgi:NhaP-type Na+/H+ or K+/H+ antiporter